MKEVNLKNGDRLIIRKAQKEDASRIIEYINNVAAESDFLTFGAGEFNVSIADEEAQIVSSIKTDNSLFIVAEIDGRIVAFLTFIGGKRPRILHIGEFGVSVLKEYWGIGIGKLVIEYLIDWAVQSKVVRKINLKVRSDHKLAINLYEKLGFRKEGLITRFFYINNKFYDAIEMGMEID